MSMRTMVELPAEPLPSLDIPVVTKEEIAERLERF